MRRGLPDRCSTGKMSIALWWARGFPAVSGDFRARSFATPGARLDGQAVLYPLVPPALERARVAPGGPPELERRPGARGLVHSSAIKDDGLVGPDAEAAHLSHHVGAGAHAHGPPDLLLALGRAALGAHVDEARVRQRGGLGGADADGYGGRRHGRRRP